MASSSIILTARYFFGVAGVAGLVESLTPEIVSTVLMFAVMAALILFFIGYTRAIGVPLPWPFVPRWVVDIRRAKRARRGERRQARKKGKGRIDLAAYPGAEAR